LCFAIGLGTPLAGTLRSLSVADLSTLYVFCTSFPVTA
jgi:hypothetical protein